MNRVQRRCVPPARAYTPAAAAACTEQCVRPCPAPLWAPSGKQQGKSLKTGKETSGAAPALTLASGKTTAFVTAGQPTVPPAEGDMPWKSGARQRG